MRSPCCYRRWEASGLIGLYDRPRPGKPRSLTSEDEDFIYDFTGQEPRSVNKIIAALKNLRGKKVSRSTVKRVLKKKKVRKRIRKSLKGKRDEEKFREAQEEIKLPEQRRKNGFVPDFFCAPHLFPKRPFFQILPRIFRQVGLSL